MGIVCWPHAGLQRVNRFRTVLLHFNACCKLEWDSLSPSCEEVTGSQTLSLLVYKAPLWKLSRAGQTWAVAIVALLLGADKCCLDEDVILSLAASPACLSCLHSVSAGVCQLRGGCLQADGDGLHGQKLLAGQLFVAHS